MKPLLKLNYCNKLFGLSLVIFLSLISESCESERYINSIHQSASGEIQALGRHIFNQTSFADELTKNCPGYCQDQVQYNSICINGGCLEWRRGLVVGCGTLCNGNESNFREFHACQRGCNRVIEDYYYNVTGLLGTLDPPALIPSSLNNTSLRLSWELLGIHLPYLVYTLQKRLYHGNHPWETLPIEPLNHNISDFLIDELKPYTEYQFRLGYLIAHDYPPHYSMESNPIFTLPKGLPNPPQVTSIQSISNTSVSITWEPPSEPNGPIVAYILKLQQTQPHGHLIIKEIPSSVQAARGYTFTGLLPNTNYTLTLSAQNFEGEGDGIVVSFVTPQQILISNDVSKRPVPRLLIQGLHQIYIQPMDLLLAPEGTVFTTTENITGMSIHFRKNLLFVSTSENSIYRTSLETNKDPNLTRVIIRRDAYLQISLISVDWLHDKFYIAGPKTGSNSWTIRKCELNGEKCSRVTDVNDEILNFFADPYTGYLYWTTKEGSKGLNSLYKLDIIEDQENSVHYVPPTPTLLIQGWPLGPFTADFLNYQLLIVHKGRNTVLSFSLDGETNDLRSSNTQSPQFTESNSILEYNGIFYFTTGPSIVMEEYNVAQKSYYQNSFDVIRSYGPCTKILLLHPDAQPIPLPLGSPVGVQGVFSKRRVRVEWSPPPTIPGLGLGAWTKWSYQIFLMPSNITISSINSTSFILPNLHPSTHYNIQVAAVSPVGRGPYSHSFQGRTLRETGYNVTLVWGSDSGLYSTDALGESVHHLVVPNQWKSNNNVKQNNNLAITSLTWHETGIIFSITNGSVFRYHDNRVHIVHGIAYAHSIGFDYIGQKLYWSNPKKQGILRCSIKRCKSTTEWLPLVTTAQEILIDSYRGLLIWSTGHSLEMSRLNGFHHSTLHALGIFSGTRVVGVTLDTDQARLFWISRSSSMTNLYRLDYTSRTVKAPTHLAELGSDFSYVAGPLRYYSDRLLYIQDPASAIITDLNGQGKSHVKVDTIGRLRQVLVRDESVQRYPPGLPKGKLTIIPDQIPAWSIVISGTWDNFTIHWSGANNTNYGRVYYELSLDDNYVAKPTIQTVFTMANSTTYRPYQEIEISIIPSTFWHSSAPTIVKRHIPPTKPSQPLNPRVYLEHLDYPYTNSSVIHAQLRWTPPANSNGVIIGYLIKCWKDSIQFWDCFTTPTNTQSPSSEVKVLTPNSTFETGVLAFTDAGSGNLSQKIVINTNYNNPISKLFITSGDKLQVLDVDKNSIEEFTSPVNPVSGTYYTLTDSLYWFESGRYLMKSVLKSNGTDKANILTLSPETTGSSLTLDWISKTLFWISENKSANVDSSEKYSIMSLYLEDESNTPRRILTSSYSIKSLVANPFTSSILWTTTTQSGLLLIYNTEIKNEAISTEQFLVRDRPNCTCNNNVFSITEAIGLDTNGLESVNLSRGILLSDHEFIWIADEEGCNCYKIVDLRRQGDNTLPHRVTADKNHVYWISVDHNSFKNLYASSKGLSNAGITELIHGTGQLLRDVLAIGPSIQTFPEKNCLVPGKLDRQEPILFNNSNHSLHLKLPKPLVANCSEPEISVTNPVYNVFYGTVNENGILECTPTSLSHCKMVKSTKSLLQINNLHPYTTYTVFVMVTNSYAEDLGLHPLICEPIMLRTAPGAPEPPKLLGLESLTPNSVRVIWGQPAKLNGEKVWYEVHWKTSESLTSVDKDDERTWKRTWTETESKSNHNNTEYSLDVSKLEAGKNYSFKVRAYSEIGDTFSDCESKTIQTWPNPNNITLINSTPDLLSVSWISPTDSSIIKHQIIYRIGYSTIWNYTEIINHTVPSRSAYNLTLLGLKPNTNYGFKLLVWYKGDPFTPFKWPKEGQLDFETIADKPGKPGVPTARGIGSSLYEITWERADENGAKVDLYSLECILKYSPDWETNDTYRRKRESELAQKFVASEQNNPHSLWFVVYNGTEPRWEFNGKDDLDQASQYMFRVRAKNYYGWGEYGPESNVVYLPNLALVGEPQSLGMIFGIITLGSVILTFFVVLFAWLYRGKYGEKPGLVNGERRREGTELATLRELPAGSSFVHQSNILYASELSLEIDFEGIPIQKVKRHQFSLITLLGSGAFGEVYEGLCSSLNSRAEEDAEHVETKVAIKTLRKGASNKEKLEFIEEAKLMAQFRHPNILQLLGVCLDSDPCLILELMSGGDLLSHLRSNRNPVENNENAISSAFTLPELLSMCLDVARGCVYLEEQHYVHRDLAARNCLVRILVDKDTNLCRRVVKIGDFGLARDIYRNDYYRKDGEGLLPVRWMSPESLVDGVFKTQSDVWAFGVLLWEIMTLGHQPYPARTNLEVLHYVRAGGTLPLPTNCPEGLSSLMLSCWEYNPVNRPSFKNCLTQLEFIFQMFISSNSQRTDSQSTTDDNVQLEDMPASERSSYASSYPGPNWNTSRNSYPKYLEVLDEDSGLSANDGYEVPIPKVHPRTAAPRQSSISSTEEIGLPTPPPFYWNTGKYRSPGSYVSYAPKLSSIEQYLKVPTSTPNPSVCTSNGPFRTLLGSSTSEEVEDDDIRCYEEDEETPTHLIHAYSDDIPNQSCRSRIHDVMDDGSNNLPCNFVSATTSKSNYTHPYYKNSNNSGSRTQITKNPNQHATVITATTC